MSEAREVQIVSGFGAPPQIQETGNTGGEKSLMMREQTELQAACVMARQFPRTEESSYNKLMKSCQRATFSEGALYAFPRGGKTVEGPSVDLAREAARVWGNMRYGLRVVNVTADQVHIRGVATDLESNASVEMEDMFSKLVQRKNKDTKITSWVEPDERDLRELINRRGAILVRNCILQLLPPDVIEDAVRQIKDTNRKAANGEIIQSPEEARRRIVMSFDRIGVNVEMMEKYLGHDITGLNADELADLRAVGKSIADGNSKREDHFEFTTRETVAAQGKAKADTLTEKAKNAAAKKKAAEQSDALSFHEEFEAWDDLTKSKYNDAYKERMNSGGSPEECATFAYRAATAVEPK